MRSSLLIIPCLALALGCKNGEPEAAEPASPVADEQQSEPQVPAPDPARDSDEDVATAAESGCEPLPEGADELYQKAESFEVTGPAHSEQRSEARSRKKELYLEAARAGQVEAQHKGGSMVFGDLYQADAPTPAQRDQYVEAIKWVMTAAARRKDKDPLASSIGNAKKLPDEIKGPLAELPREWVQAAFEASREWLACYDPNWEAK